MIINEIKVRNLYGFMNKSIEFKNNISILVGINGSGKTSILNLINWILKPSFKDLCTIEFESIHLKFSYKQDDFILKCVQHKKEITFDLENISKKKVYPKIQATFKVHPKKLTKNEALKESLFDIYENLRPEAHEEETWSFLFSELPKPIVIGLDRNLYIEEGQEVRFQAELFDNIKPRIGRRGKFTESTPLEKVNILLNKEYNSYRNKVFSLYSSLNEKIMLSAFDQIFTKHNIDSLLESTKPTLETIELLKKQVVAFLHENRNLHSKPKKINQADNSVKKINTYFNNLKSIIKATSGKDDLLYITNISQFKKINDLVLEFSQFEEDTKKLYSPLKEFLDTLNKFFLDSAKELYFDKENSEIKFSILNKEGKKIDEGRDIKNLSSGERQILILLTYLKYNNSQNIFIIDEPELSLHPKWQGEFLEAVDKLMPKQSQLIIATHSPEVIGDKRKFCSVLLPYN